MKISVFTLGCKVNQYESGVIVAKLKQLGHNAFEGLETADIYIINTCAVTSEAEKKSRQAVARAKKCNPNCKIFIVGCAGQNNAEQFKMDNVKFVKGVAKKTDIVNLLNEEGVLVDSLPVTFENENASEISKIRQTIKIQDGCDNFCSYCLVPFLRGRSRSRSISDILEEIDRVKNDVKEIVLTGIDISSYGKDLGMDISDLIESLDEINLRLRIGSLEVNVITEKLLSVLKKNRNFCPHFHLSLQSGSDRVLEKMNRHYTVAEYQSKVELIRNYFPEAGFTTDVIVGFPTEDEEMFNETCDFVQTIGFSDIHVFPYSRRSGTAADKLPQVDSLIKAERVSHLTEIKLELKKKFLLQNLGKVVEVLVEQPDKGVLNGYTKNYIKVYLKNNFVKNSIYNVRLVELYKDGVVGR